MRHTLVGCTGFVGGNLARGHAFGAAYHAADITESFGRNNGLVVYAGVPSEKFLANADPDGDRARVLQAMDNIRRMCPERLVLISTVDVYPRPAGVYEDSPAGGGGAGAYGRNRLELERLVRAEYPDALILRLPGLFGSGMKKNFIFDMFTLTPSTLTEQKYRGLAAGNPLVRDGYARDGSGFYRLRPLPAAEAERLRAFYEQNDFNALSFTDSRSVFQFYDLSRLWGDICRCLKARLRLVNLATEPVEAGVLYRALFGTEFVNELAAEPARYDMRTRYGRELGGADEYVADRDEVVAGVARLGRDWGRA